MAGEAQPQEAPSTPRNGAVNAVDRRSGIFNSLQRWLSPTKAGDVRTAEDTAAPAPADGSAAGADTAAAVSPRKSRRCQGGTPVQARYGSQQSGSAAQADAATTLGSGGSGGGTEHPIEDLSGGEGLFAELDSRRRRQRGSGSAAAPLVSPQPPPVEPITLSDSETQPTSPRPGRGAGGKAVVSSVSSPRRQRPR